MGMAILPKVACEEMEGAMRNFYCGHKLGVAPVPISYKLGFLKTPKAASGLGFQHLN